MPMTRVCGSSGNTIRPVELVGATLVVSCSSLTSGESTKMELAQEVLCDGKLDFVHAAELATGILSGNDCGRASAGSECIPRAVLQETGLGDAMRKLTELRGVDNSWVLGDEDPSFRSSLEGVKLIHRRLPIVDVRRLGPVFAVSKQVIRGRKLGSHVFVFCDGQLHFDLTVAIAQFNVVVILQRHFEQVAGDCGRC